MKNHFLNPRSYQGQPLSQEVKFTKQRHKYISESTIGLNEQIFVSDHDTSAEEYTLMAQKPVNCQGMLFNIC